MKLFVEIKGDTVVFKRISKGKTFVLFETKSVAKLENGFLVLYEGEKKVSAHKVHTVFWL